MDEPQLKAMFETAAEVLGGLIKAFRDYEHKNERCVAGGVVTHFLCSSWPRNAQPRVP